MRLLFCLSLAFLLISAPAYSQTTSKDSQTLQVLLAEVRHLREVCKLLVCQRRNGQIERADMLTVHHDD